MNDESLVRIYDPSTDAARIEARKAEGAQFVDDYDEEVKELAEIMDPTNIGSALTSLANPPAARVIDYPYRNVLVRVVEESAFRILRSNRNLNLITADEQERFRNFRVAYAGLNVGNPGAVCIALEGGSSFARLADLDPLSLTNLNRFRAGLPDVGVNKAILTARQILEVDPYYELELFADGLTPGNLSAFLDGMDLLVEEMDALPLKLAVRQEAAKRGIPVIMVTGNGEGVLLDVERYDLDPKTKLLNGYIGDEVVDAIRNPSAPLVPREKVKLARDFMGVEYLDERLVASFAEFGSTLVGIPQLAESSFLRGAALCYAAKAIALGRDLPNGRYSFAFADNLKTV